MQKILIDTIIILCLSYLVIMVVLYLKQGTMLYAPERDVFRTPQNIGLAYEEVNFQTEDGITISGWYIPAKDEKGTVLFCHGNAGNISHRLDSVGIFHSLNFSVLIFDYRGYGKSEGKPSEKGTYLDAEATWDYLVNVKKKAPENIVIFGRSLGGAIAAEIALKKNPACLIIESSFTSIPELAAKLYPWLPVRYLSKFKYSTVEKIRFIKCPKLIIHSPEDELIPYKFGKSLYEKASLPKEFLEIKGGHNDGFLISGKVYSEGVKKFLEKYRGL
ncbi:MAG: alpha/beta hydrolase [Proteobacteria bacterium]|nr:alpha/beta hydrolase [Pseudomonadota bacterium]